ncbi:hypothetical protein BGW38_002570, partial [Lunasporangiospora selenospora]
MFQKPRLTYYRTFFPKTARNNYNYSIPTAFHRHPIAPVRPSAQQNALAKIMSVIGKGASPRPNVPEVGQRFLNLYGLAFVASLVAAGTFHQPYGHGHKDAPQPNRVIASNYILQFESHLAHSQAHDFLRAHNVQYEVRHDYTAIFHGTAIRLLSDHDGPTLAQIPGIKNVWPTTLHDRPTIISSVAPSLASPSQNKRRRALPGDNKDNDNNNATPYTLHHMTGVNILQDQLKLTGKGIKVAIVDSGVDYRHPAFALPGATEGCFGISPDGTPCRVAFGYDFAGDDYNGQSEAVGDSDPMDCGGHGTHVAGIVGADARNLPAGAKPHPSRPFVGVAPEVTLGAYRVFGCKGGADNAVILA